jgi:hypothetical protein
MSIPTSAAAPRLTPATKDAAAAPATPSNPRLEMRAFTRHRSLDSEAKVDIGFLIETTERVLDVVSERRDVIKAHSLIKVAGCALMNAGFQAKEGSASRSCILGQMIEQ